MDKTKILIIEDAPFIQEMLRKKFDLNKLEVMKALTGRDGYELAKTHRPDLILLDLTLPDVSGMKVLEKIKEDPDLGKIQLMIITNIGSQEMMKRAVELGVSDYFVKANHSFFSIVEMINTYLKIIEQQKQTL